MTRREPGEGRSGPRTAENIYCGKEFIELEQLILEMRAVKRHGDNPGYVVVLLNPLYQ